MDNNAQRHYETQRAFFEEDGSTHSEYRLVNWQRSFIARIFKALALTKLCTSNEECFCYLDIGSGWAGYAVSEAAKKGYKAIGIDLSLPAAQKAKSFARQQGVAKQCSFVVCNAEQLPFTDGVFSRASAIEVLNYLIDDRRALAEIQRVCGAGARSVSPVHSRAGVPPEIGGSHHC